MDAIVDHAHILEQLRQENQQMTELLGILNVQYFSLDAGGRVLAVHPRFAAAQGRSPADVTGLPLAEAFPRLAGTAIESACQRLLAGEAVEPLEWREPARTGQVGQWYQLTFARVSTGGAVFFHDISDQKELAQALNESERYLAQISIVNPAVLYLRDLRLNYSTYFNAETVRLLGYPLDQLNQMRGSLPDALMHPEDLPRLSDHMTRLVELPPGEKASFEYRLRCADGSYKWFLTQEIVYRRDRQGKALQLLGSAIDMTAMRATLHALASSEERYRLAARATADAIWDWDILADRVQWNDALSRAFGYDQAGADTTSEWWLERIHPQDRERVQASLQHSLDGRDENWSDEYRFRRVDGSYAVVFDRGWVVRGASGEPLRMIGAMQDISDRREAEEALRASERELSIREQTFRGTFENAAVGMSHVTLDGRWLMVNQRLCEITGYTQDELLAMTFRMITHPDDLQADLDQMAALLRGEISGYQMEKRYYHKRGHIVWVNLNVSLQVDEQGQPLYLITIIQDINERKRLEANDRFLLEIGDGLAAASSEEEAIRLVVNRVGEYLQLDRCLALERSPGSRLVRIPVDFHRDLPSMTGIIDLSGMHPAIYAELAAGKQRVVADIQQQNGLDDALRDTMLGGSLRAYVNTAFVAGKEWVGSLIVSSAAPRAWLPDERQLLRSVTNLLWLSLDKMRLLAELAESEARFRVALERSGLVTFHQDRDLRYTWLHNPPEVFLSQDPVGKTDYELMAQIGLQRLIEVKQRVLETGEAAREEIVREWEGQRYCFELVIEAVRDETGTITGLVGSALNITERYNAEQAIKEYASKLERSNKDLQDFAFVASHDLQEPLRKVKAFGDRLKARQNHLLDEQGLDYLNRMISATERMRHMVDGLLAFSRVSTKGQPFTRVDLNQVAEEVLASLETSIESCGGQVEVGDLPVIEADELQMSQLLQNLISNALKYHRPEQPPVVRVSARSVEPNQVELLVADDGIGFDVQYLERIFQPFQRLHGRSEYEGSGIGLTICRRIAERHGGTITARSAPGQGSTFIVRLPERR